MLILGISAYYHDSAAALIEDGRVVSAAQEERFTRKKQDACYPQNAINYCLNEGNYQLADIDWVVFYDKPFLKFERLLETYMSFAPKGFHSFRMALPVWLKEKLFQKKIEKSFKSKIDIIITSGAVSAGKHDFVPYIIKKFSLSNFFKGVSIRPGKPVLFAKFNKTEKAIFGLPGNPISSSACFRFFVYPYLLNILGVRVEKPFKAKLKNNYSKSKKIIRFLKAKLTSTNDGKIELEVLKGQESFRIKSFVESNVWGLFKDGQSIFKKGELIECYSPIGSNINIFK